VAATLCAAVLLGGVVAALDPSASGVPAATAAAPLAVAPSAPLTRYSIVNGCLRLRSATTGQELGSAAGPFRMQATALGEYLLYGVHRDFLADASTESTLASPGASTVWRVAGPPFVLTNLGTGASVPVSLAPATGCAVYPEAEVDGTGSPFAGASPEATVLGTVEGHAHVTAFEFIGGDLHCGRPWSPFGAPYALPADCSPYEQGTNGQFESFLDFGGESRPADMHGWPTFRDGSAAALRSALRAAGVA
jgi:hypothetical protein